MQIKRHILYWLLCLLPLATLAQTSDPNAEVTPEALHQEIGARMMHYADELSELAIVGNIQVTFYESSPLSVGYVNVLRNKVNLLDERYNSINVRWTTFIQAMQMDIADDDELMAIMSNVEQLKQGVADTIASKRNQCDALQSFAQAEELLSGQDSIYKSLYNKAFKLSLVKKLTPQLEKLKAREQALFAQLQESYQKAKQACEVVPSLSKRMPALDDTFAGIQMVSTKIQGMAYKPFIQRIKDYLIGLACVAVLLLFFNMLSSKIKSLKVARQQAKQYKDMMQRNAGGPGDYPTI